MDAPGQLLLFPRPQAALEAAEEWFERGCALEATAPGRAILAYRHAVECQPDHAKAHVNLGRLLHALGNARTAATHYRLALKAQPVDATAAFNLGVALEDLKRPAEAAQAYRDAIHADGRCADAYFNLSRLCEREGRRAEALRWLKAYRALVAP